MLDPVTRAILKWCAVLAVACVLLLVGGANERKAHRATLVANATVLRSLADKAKAAEAKAARASEVVRGDRAVIDARHKEAMTDAKREADRLRAALRAGDARLQDRWTCPVPGAGEGGAAAGTGEADPAGRFDSLARVHAAVASDAAVIDWLWESWMADRQAVIDGGCAVSP